jgi:hypothetical protein
MICLTGNVHHRSYRDVDRRHAKQTEPQLALQYCDIAARHQVKLTLFLTGQGLPGGTGHHRNPGPIQPLRDRRTYLLRLPLNPALVFHLPRRVPLGSISMQRGDIERTIAAILRAT